MCVYIYVASQVFLQGDSVILERSNNIKTKPKCFMEVDSNEPIQLVNMMFWEVDADKKDVLREQAVPQRNNIKSVSELSMQKR